MTKQVQRRRGTATQHTSFTGAEGELSVNTTNKSVHVHDNVTAGGFEAARVDMDNVTSSSILTAAGITATTTELNYVDGVTSAIQTQIDGKAGTASPTFTGTLTAANLTAAGTTTLAGASTSADITFGDNDKAIFGAGSDLQIYHDGGNSRIQEQGTGNLIIRASSGTYIQGVNGENGLAVIEDGTTTAYYDGAPKLATTAAGVTISGTALMDSLRVDGNATISSFKPTLTLEDTTGAAQDDAEILADASELRFRNATSDTTRMLVGLSTGDISFYEDTGTTPKFFWDASAESLGIGTDSPSAKLDVRGAIRLGTTVPDVADGGRPIIYASDGTGAHTGHALVIQARDGAGSEIDFVTGTTPTTRMHIASGGSVGIGTSSPSANLQVENSSGAATLAITSQSANATGSSIWLGDTADEDVGYINYSQYTNSMQIGTNGSERMRITSSGNVGIGTSSPEASRRLTVDIGTTAITSAVFKSSDTDGGSYISFMDKDTTNSNRVRVGAINDDMSFLTAGSEAMRIDSSGNVGIGATPPTTSGYTNLTLGASTTGSQIRLYGATSGFFHRIINNNGDLGIQADADNVKASTNLTFSVDGSEAMRIDSSGNVGIGTSSPTAVSTYKVVQVTGGTTTTGGLLRLETSNASHVGRVYVDSSGTVIEATTATDPMLFRTNNSERMRIDSSGNIKVSSDDKQIYWGTGTTAIDASSANNRIRFYTSNSEAMRLDASGRLLLGTTTFSTANNGILGHNDGRFYATSTSQAPLNLNRKTSDGDIAAFSKDGSTVGSIGTNGGLFISNSTGNAGLKFWAGAAIVPCNADGSYSDNDQDLGYPTVRFDDIYATNGTIQTSDRNEKQDIAELSDAEQRVAVAAKGLMRKFRWRDAVEAKGDDARTHFGIIAQDLQAAFAAEGLDAGDYAMFISSTWWEHDVEVSAVEAVAEVLDEEGNVVTEAVEAVDAYTRTDTYDTQEEAPEGATERTRLGVRYSELLAFIIGAI